MKKYLIFLVLILSHFSIHAEGLKLSCIAEIPTCENCPEYKPLFPIEKFSSNSDSLDIEADNSAILTDKYHLTGKVEINSESLFLAADDVKVTPVADTIVAKGNVKFQDLSYLISSDSLSAMRDEDGNLIANATNAYYQDYSEGLAGANGYTEIISKTPTIVKLTNSTYSLCPINENDWLIDADYIELNLKKNRGVASNAIIVFHRVPIFYLPKYSWVLSGRGSGFLTPSYYSYQEFKDAPKSYRIRVPYYFNLAPDRDLLIALDNLSSRGLIYEAKYRQIILPKLSSEQDHSLLEIETNFVPKDKLAKDYRWLIDATMDLDFSKNSIFSAKYNRASDPKYFREIARTNTNITSLKSFVKLGVKVEEKNLYVEFLSEDEQIVNDGTPSYNRALQGLVSKSFNSEGKYPLDLGLRSTKFIHKTPNKPKGIRTHGDFAITRGSESKFPTLSTRANIANTYYSLDNSDNINRTVFGAGANLAFPLISERKLFGSSITHKLTPEIAYNYRGKSIQGNIPIFDTSDKYDDILSFASLTSGERYTGLDRITNANDFTLSLVSSSRGLNALEDDRDILNMKIAQSFYTDDQVVSNSINTNYETRRSYSDIAASIDLSLSNFIASTKVQFDPDQSLIKKRQNSFTYKLNSRKFISLGLTDDGSKKIAKLYAAVPISKSIHVFGGLDKTTSTGITNSETTGIAYESCCWAFRVAHFKNGDLLGDHSYSTGMELVLTGLGSTSTPLKNEIEGKIPGYTAKLR